jgi:predicted amidohydrolase
MSTSPLRAAAVQLEAAPADAAENLRRLETLVAEAVRGGARVIALPEFMSSPIYLGSGAEFAVQPRDGRLLEALQRWAQRDRVMIGGSWLTADGDEVYNRYHLVEPDGRVHRHDKDLPTMWERAFYTFGRDDGRFETALGSVGTAVCWELIRTQTVRRLQGIQLAMTGTHWWTPPENWGPLSGLIRGLSLFQYNRYLSEQAPVEFARRLGCPVLQASHCGAFTADFLLLPYLDSSLPHRARYVGHTQIVDAGGHVLAMRRQEEGPGVVLADITPAAVTPAVPLETRFWVPELPLFHRAYWHQQNLASRPWYTRHGRAAGLASARSAAGHRLQPTPAPR